MKKLNIIWILFIILSFSLVSVTLAKSESDKTSDTNLKWTTIDKAVEDSKSGNKNFILLDLYTDWCGWCKKMDENTFSDPVIISMLNSNFTVVKFNAETSDVITFNGKQFGFVKTGARGANQLAVDLGSVGGRLGYPTLVVLDANGKKLQSFAGYKDVQTLTTILKYFQSGTYKTMDFQQFQSGQ